MTRTRVPTEVPVTAAPDDSAPTEGQHRPYQLVNLEGFDFSAFACFLRKHDRAWLRAAAERAKASTDPEPPTT